MSKKLQEMSNIELIRWLLFKHLADNPVLIVSLAMQSNPEDKKIADRLQRMALENAMDIMSGKGVEPFSPKDLMEEFLKRHDEQEHGPSEKKKETGIETLLLETTGKLHKLQHLAADTANFEIAGEAKKAKEKIHGLYATVRK